MLMMFVCVCVCVYIYARTRTRVKKDTEALVVASMEFGLEVNADKTD
jgi:hypothetical protein